MKVFSIVVLCLFSFQVTATTCQKALQDNDAAINLFGANGATAQTGWQAYEVCKNELDREGQALATLLEGRCTRTYNQSGSMYRSFEAQCALKGVQFLQRQN